MANTRNTVTDTYEGETIQCAEFSVDTADSFMVCPLDKNGDYAFQMIAKADGNKAITVVIGDKSHTFDLTTSWAYYSHIFEEVTVNNSYMLITFPIGTYRLYHSKLEHGNKLTDWNENPDYTNKELVQAYTLATQTADQFSWLVSSGTSSANFTLTDRTAELVAQFINLNGLVAFGGITESIKQALMSNTFGGGYQLFVDKQDMETFMFGAIYCYPTKDATSKTATMHFNGSDYTISAGVVANYDKFSFAPDIYYLVYDTANSKYMLVLWNTYMGEPEWSAYDFTQNADKTDVTRSEMHTLTWTSNMAVLAEVYKVPSVAGKTSHFIQYDRPRIYDAVTNSIVEQNINSILGSKLGELCADANMTIINGGKIATGSVDADKISVNDLKSLNATIGGWSIGDDGLYKTVTTYVYPTLEHVELIRKYLLGTGTLTPEQKAWFDYNNSGDVEVIDGLVCKKLAIGAQTIEEVMADSRFANYNKPTFNVTVKLNPFDVNNAILLTSTAYGETQERFFGMAKSETGGLAEDLVLKKQYANIYTYDESFDTYTFWNERNMVCGKGETSSISGNTGGAFVIQLPTAQIGTDPIVTVTTTRTTDTAWIGGISTTGTNTQITIGVYNGSSSAHTIVLNYMIAKNS